MTTLHERPLAEAEISDQHRMLVRAARARARRDTLSMWVVRVGLVGAALLAWWGVGALGLMRASYVSNPVAVTRYLFETLPEADFWADVWSTTAAALLGLGIGAVTGVLSGVVIANIPTLRRATQPIITFLNALPRAALAPVFLVWFGLSIWSKVAVSGSTVYFVMLLTTIAGIDGVAQDHRSLSSSLRMTRWQRFRFIEMPAAGPSIVAGLRLATVYSVLGVVVSEMVASRSGLGVRLVYETNTFNIAGAFGVIIVLAILAVLLDAAVTWIERRMRWNSAARS